MSRHDKTWYTTQATKTTNDIDAFTRHLHQARADRAHLEEQVAKTHKMIRDMPDSKVVWEMRLEDLNRSLDGVLDRVHQYDSEISRLKQFLVDVRAGLRMVEEEERKMKAGGRK